MLIRIPHIFLPDADAMRAFLPRFDVAARDAYDGPRLIDAKSEERAMICR